MYRKYYVLLIKTQIHANLRWFYTYQGKIMLRPLGKLQNNLTLDTMEPFDTLRIHIFIMKDIILALLCSGRIIFYMESEKCNKILIKTTNESPKHTTKWHMTGLGFIKMNSFGLTFHHIFPMFYQFITAKCS